MTKSQLTPEQKLVVNHPFGQHARVLAVAGSGKSTTMAYRIKYLIQEGGIQSDCIMALMFNSLARKQFNAHLEKAGVSIKPPVHTFHSFSFQVIHRAMQCELLPASTQFWLSDKEELIWLMVKRAINNLEKSKKIPSEMIDPELALNTIQLWKGALIPPHRAGSTASEYLPLVYDEFERLRQIEQILTFDDFIPVTVSLLETNSHIAQRYTQNLQHLIVDEYQDINFGQQQLIELLAGKQADVMVVGDDDQTVYEWRGARPNYILNDFTKVFDNKPIQDYKLSRSFRFGPLIAQCAANLISNNLNRLEKPLIASQPSQYGFIHVITGGQNEAKELTEQITALVNGDHVPKKEIIVLARLYAQLDHLESEFLNRKIPYRVEGQEPFFKRQEIKALLDYLRLALVYDRPINDQSGDWLINIVNKPSRMLSRMVISKIISEAKYHRWTMKQLIDETVNQSELGLSSNQIHQFTHLNSLLSDVHDKINSGISAGAVLDWLIQTLDYLTYFNNYYGPGEHADEKKYAVLNFVRYVSSLDVTPIALLDHIQHLETTQGKSDDDLIVFTTIFRTKGLEYDFVVLPQCEDGLLPYLKSDLSAVYDKQKLVNEWQLSPKLESERRLFYVALTRARKGVLVGISTKPSQFLGELQLHETEAIMSTVQHLASGDRQAEQILKRDLQDNHSHPLVLSNLLSGYLPDMGKTKLVQNIQNQPILLRNLYQNKQEV